MARHFIANRSAQRSIERRAKVARDRKAAEINVTAKLIAPVATGHYRDSLHVESDESESRVVADVDYWNFVEARDNVLARALNARR